MPQDPREYRITTDVPTMGWRAGDVILEGEDGLVRFTLHRAELHDEAVIRHALSVAAAPAVPPRLAPRPVLSLMRSGA